MPFPPELFAQQAERRVALGLILSEVVESNKLEAKQDQIKAMITEFADSYEDPAEVLTWYYASPDRLEGRPPWSWKTMWLNLCCPRPML